MPRGRIQISVTQDKILTEDALSRVADMEQGAQLLFTGVVREWNLGRRVTAVAYDAFEPLAMQVLKEICEEAQAKWGDSLHFCVQHRTGKLKVGEVSVVIAVGSKHRDEAYQASRYVIEELKERVPIWKKEYYEGGETGWLKGHALCAHRSDHISGGHVHSHVSTGI